MYESQRCYHVTAIINYDEGCLMVVNASILQKVAVSRVAELHERPCLVKK